MINAIFHAISSIIKKPWLVLPALIVSAITAALYLLTIETTVSLFLDLFFFGKMPQTTLIELPFRIMELYPTETLTIIAFVTITVLFNILALMAYAKFAKEDLEKEKTSIGRILSNMFSKTGQAILLLIAIALIAIAVSSGWFLLFALTQAISFAWIIHTIIFVLLIYVAIKLLFIVPALVEVSEARTGGKKILKASGGIKEAFEKSWEFSQKHLFSIIALIVILGLINLAAETLIGTATELIETDELALIVMYLLLSVLSAFSSLSICNYYFQNQK